MAMTRNIQTQSTKREQDEIDLRGLDLRALTPDQWLLLKNQIIRRAQVERAKAIREMFGRMFVRRGRHVHRASDAAMRPTS
jgi:predicted nucleotidyltransferase